MSKSRGRGWLVLAFLLGGCSDESATPPNTTEPAPLRFKRTDRLVNDYSRWLELSSTELCTEPGGSACAEVHRIALGSPSPHDAVYAAPDHEAVTAPNAIDRLTLGACRRRVELDLDSAGQHRIFGPSPGPTTERHAIEELYRRAFQRLPTGNEIQALLALSDPEATTGAEAYRRWSILACFVILSSEEALFY